MKRDTQVALIERVLALIEGGEKQMAPTQSSVEVGVYLDQARLEAERRDLLWRLPIIVGHASELRSAGDFITHDASGRPLLIVRDGSGALRGFLNVCRHRGTRVVQEARGSGRKAFVCPYHGWTYGQSGALMHVPDGFGFPEVECGAVSLKPIPVAEHHGLVWAVASPGEGALDVGAFLGAGLDAELGEHGLGGHMVYRREDIVRGLNWKLVFDVFLEAYHLKYAHRDSIYPMFFNNLGLFEQFGPHMRNVFPKRSMASLRETPPESWQLREHGNLLYVLFPNTLVLAQPDFFSVLGVFPEGVDGARLVTWHLLPEAIETEKARRYWDKNIGILLHAVGEDLTMGESIQRGLGSGANARLTFGRFEQSLGWFHEAIEAALTPDRG